MQRSLTAVPMAVATLLLGSCTAARIARQFPEAQDVRYCELVAQRERYQGRVVRVRAAVAGDFENTFLFDRSCPWNLTWFEEGAEVRMPWHVRLEDRLSTPVPSRPGPDPPALQPTPFLMVTVIGRFDSGAARGYGHENWYPQRLTVLALLEMGPRGIAWPPGQQPPARQRSSRRH